ncbi:hypothetical protein [Dyella japonica]|uniref:DUF4136 domain-containing protein n=1 Tax=Dyella japonica A8 TaxID=1217721 RepID=A0A075K262_9GAMM|nr:hypothetical protein [Dyella japonica]AIF48416.1 hypothetical protein HY57_14795 [Dyella japonica A8]
MWLAVLASALAGGPVLAFDQARSVTGVQMQGPAANVFASSIPAPAERAKLLAEHFIEVRDVAAFPASCKSGFAVLARTSGFELANPGQPYQATDVMGRGPRLPWRRLLIGGVSADRCVVFYEIGGFAPYRSVVVLDISGKGLATPTWGGADGKNPENLPALISQITKGAFTQPRGY